MIDLNSEIAIFRCPKCGGSLAASEVSLTCEACTHVFPIEDDVPLLFWPEGSEGSERDVTQIVKAFYEETPFPNYDDFDSVSSLAQKARMGVFARMLDDQVPPGASIIECGCGTGQLSNFLSIANRKVFAADMCMNSLRLGQGFAREHQLSRVRFIQMNLMRPAFQPESFDLVISNGVLMTTPDPFGAFQTISGLVKPGGYLLIGLYHKYGRLGTDLRRAIFRVTGDRLLFLDPTLRKQTLSEGKRRAWFADQYKHPHEVKHTIAELIGWVEKIGFSFIRSIPRTKLFQPMTGAENLFEVDELGSSLERLLVELSQAFRGGLDGGFFTIICRKSS